MKTELLRERYEPLEVAGRGGEAEVIRALDHLHGRQVALKVRSVADEASRAHLLSEARLLLSLSPASGAAARPRGLLRGRPVRHRDGLDRRHGPRGGARRRGPPGLDPALAIGYLEQAAEALEHLHTHDPPVVHGDVKPANLILTSSGRIVLVDFGLSSTPTDELRRAGTAGYMAPEVAAGARPTAASDVYSFAATALALLTGEPLPGGRRAGARSSASGSRRWSGSCARTWPPIRRVATRRRPRSSPGCGAGGAPPSDGERSRSCWPTCACPRGTPRTSVNDVAGAHRGHCVAPVDDGPLLAAFASARDGLDAARELAGRLDARGGRGHGRGEPRAGELPGRGGIRGGPAPEAGRSGTGRDRRSIAEAVGDRLPAGARPRRAAETRGRRAGAGCSWLPGWRSRRAPTPAPIAG